MTLNLSLLIAGRSLRLEASPGDPDALGNPPV